MAFLRGQPGKENRIGYCHNPNHRGYLSVNLLKNHKCLEKQSSQSPVQRVRLRCTFICGGSP